MSSMKRKIRIMHVAECAGGVERYLCSLIKYLEHEKFENILVCSQNYFLDQFENIVDDVIQIRMAHAIEKSDFQTTIKLRKIIKKIKPDIVYAHSSKAGALVRIANIGIRNKCIYNPHGWAFNIQCSKKQQRMYKIVERIMVPFCNKIVCISNAEKQSAIDKKICCEDKIQVILNGVDIESFDTHNYEIVSKDELGIPEDVFIVGMVGRLCPQKAPDVFVRMAKRIKEQIPDAHFIMVGEGEQEEEIREFLENNQMSDCVHITGWVNNPLSYIELFDVATLLSRWEGFGLAIPEYMLAEKPVVATAVDAIPNIVIDGVNGVLVPVDDDEKASEAVIRLKSDSSLRKRLINQATIDVHEKYDSKRVAEEHKVMFEKMLYFNC